MPDWLKIAVDEVYHPLGSDAFSSAGGRLENCIWVRFLSYVWQLPRRVCQPNPDIPKLRTVNRAMLRSLVLNGV